MARLVDCQCPMGHEFEKMCEADAEVLCPEHLIPCLQLWWQVARPRERTVWNDQEAVVVFKKLGQDGREAYSFPARASKPTPPGYERLLLRSDRDVERIEKAAGVRHERRWYDSNGSGPEDDIDRSRAVVR